MIPNNQHLDNVTNEIFEQLNVLFASYDTKLLAIAMFMKSTAALRGLHSAGIFKVEDVQAIIQNGMHDIYVPLPADKTPQVAFLPPQRPTRLN